jgi:hypothetical protein
MAWILGIVILILMVGFSVYQLNRSNEAAKLVDAWRPKHDHDGKSPD